MTDNELCRENRTFSNTGSITITKTNRYLHCWSISERNDAKSGTDNLRTLEWKINTKIKADKAIRVTLTTKTTDIVTIPKHTSARGDERGPIGVLDSL